MKQGELIPSKPQGECYPHSRDNSKGRMDEAVRVNHPLTYDQEFLIFIFASQGEREEGPPDPILRPIHSAKKKITTQK